MNFDIENIEHLGICHSDENGNHIHICEKCNTPIIYGIHFIRCEKRCYDIHQTVKYDQEQPSETNDFNPIVISPAQHVVVMGKHIIKALMARLQKHVILVTTQS